MSGPKSSRYTLTAAQRTALMVSLQKRLVQQERIRLSTLLAQIENDSQQIQVFTDDGEKSATVGNVHLIEQYTPLLSGELPDSLDALVAASKKLQSAYQKLNLEAGTLSKKAKSMEASWKEQIVQDMTKGFGATLDSALETRRLETQQEHQKRLAQLEQVVIGAVRKETAVQAQKLMRQYRQAPTDAFRNTIFVTSIQPLLTQHQKEREQYDREEAEYQQLLRQYEDLCQELSIPQEPQPWAPGALKVLHTLVDQLEQRWMRQEEEAYICRTLDEVMQEMGYSLIGTREVTKRTGKRFRHVLYTFDDGTAIDVTYSDDGQIAMELGGLDDRDRIPDDHETIYLCDAMEYFCTSFEQIEKKLASRGVVLKDRIHMLPPTEENAQIINAGDYQLSVTPSLLDVEHKAEDGQKKKQLYKDGE